MADSKKLLKILGDVLDRAPSAMAGPSIVEKKLLVPIEKGFEDSHIAGRLQQAEDARDTMNRLGIVSPEAVDRTHARRLKDITQEASMLSDNDDYALALRQKKALEAKPVLSTEEADDLNHYKDMLDMLRSLRGE